MLETKQLIMLPAGNADNLNLLEMLKNDGDFRMFCGVDFSEENLTNFEGYFSGKNMCAFSLFRKEEATDFIGYVGFSLREKNRYEVDFYIAKKHRNRGYCTEAVQKLLEVLKTDGLSIDGSIIHCEKVYATTLEENDATKRTLEKCGFERNAEGPVLIIEVFMDKSTNKEYDNCILEYVIKL